MDKSSNGPVGTESAPEEKSAGQILRDARLARSLSVQEVARQLRLSIRQVTALEEDDYSKLSSGTFLRGFVRNYAKLLQVDPAPLLRRIEQSMPSPQTQTISYQIEGIPFPSGRSQGKRAIIIGALIVVALLLLIYEIYRGNETNPERRQTEVKTEIKDQADTPPPAAPKPQSSSPGAMNEVNEANIREANIRQTEKAGRPSSRVAETPVVGKKPAPPLPVTQAPVLAPPSKPVPKTLPAVPPKSESGESSNATSVPTTPESADDTGDVVRLTFEGDSWAEVKDGRGKLLLSRVNRPGTQQVLRGKPPFSLTIGNAAGVKLVYNNKPIDLARYTNAYGGTARLSLE